VMSIWQLSAAVLASLMYLNHLELWQRHYEAAALVAIWPAPGSEEAELGVLMELEVDHGETEVYPRVQA
jgi:hypothetical protein